MYEIGKVYIWINQTGETSVLNGTECTVLDRPRRVLYRELNGGGVVLMAKAQATDSMIDGFIVFAEPGDLLPKRPPAGERSVMDLFRNAAPVPVMTLSDAAFERLVRDLSDV